MAKTKTIEDCFKKIPEGDLRVPQERWDDFMAAAAG
jgi:hypothetical protein